MFQIDNSPRAVALKSGLGYLPDQPLAAALATRPDILLDVQPGHVVGGAASNVGSAFAAINQADGAMLEPAGPRHPVLHSGGRLLGYGSGTGLRHPAERVIATSGKLVVGWVSRLGAGQGGQIIGQRKNLMDGASWIGFDYSTGNLSVFYGGVLRAVYANVTQADGQVHSYLVSLDPDAGKVGFEIDNNFLGFQSSVVGGWGADGPIVVGGIGADAPDGFIVGEVNGPYVKGGTTLRGAGETAALASVRAYLADRKAKVQASIL